MYNQAMNAPIYASQIACGLFGIADDFSEGYLSLDEKYLANRESTFFVRASGDSMQPKIFENDILIVDRSIPLESGQIAAFYLNGNAICKIFHKAKDGIILKSLNPKYQDIKLSSDDDLQLFGVVVASVRDFI
jgi:DNA polymerase V